MEPLASFPSDRRLASILPSDNHSIELRSTEPLVILAQLGKGGKAGGAAGLIRGRGGMVKPNPLRRIWPAWSEETAALVLRY
jgi:hypothetical protein